MATHKPLILLDGLVKQLPTGDSIEGATGGGGGSSLPTTTAIGQVLTSQGSNPVAWGNLRKSWTSFTATSTFTAPFDGYFRFYAFGKGGDAYRATGIASSGGGGGCAYGDIYLIKDTVVNITISAGIVTIESGGIILFTANPSTNADAVSGGIGGTASIHASVINGGAFSGGNGVFNTSGAVGATCGSPLGNGKNGVGVSGSANLNGLGVVADGGKGASGSSLAGRTPLTRFIDPLLETCKSPCPLAPIGASGNYPVAVSDDGAGGAAVGFGSSFRGYNGGFMGGGSTNNSAPTGSSNGGGDGGFGSSGAIVPASTYTLPGFSGEAAGGSVWNTTYARLGGPAICLLYY